MECNVYQRQDYGGYWRRGFADFLDGILLAILSTVVGAILKGLTGTIVQILIFLTYMIGFKASRGDTPGYQFLDMKVVAITGAEVTVKQIVVRLISSVFSALAFGLGFIWIAIDANRQAWHDKIAGTYVVRSGAKPIRTVEIPQTSLVRVRLFTSLLLTTAVLLIGFFGGVMYLVKSSDVYAEALARAKANDEVKALLGASIEEGFWFSGNTEVSGPSGKADLAIPISGPKGSATIYAVAKKSAGRWEFSILEVAPKGSDARIDLLQSKPGK